MQSLVDATIGSEIAGPHFPVAKTGNEMDFHSNGLAFKLRRRFYLASLIYGRLLAISQEASPRFSPEHRPVSGIVLSSS